MGRHATASAAGLLAIAALAATGASPAVLAASPALSDSRTTGAAEAASATARAGARAKPRRAAGKRRLSPRARRASRPSGMRAGAAAADITSPVGTPMFAYTARSYVFSPDPKGTFDRALQIIADPDLGLYAKSFEPSRGIHTRILARALVLERDGVRYALAQAELGGLPYAMTQEVARRVEAAGAGIDPANILLSATHTHAAMGNIWPLDNNGYAFVGGDAFDPRTFEQVATGIAAAIVRAAERLKPARVGVGHAEVRDASRNREFEPYQRNPDIPADPEAQRAHSIDPTVTVVRVDDAAGRPMGVWSNFAVHPTSFGDGNALFSGDNAGIAARLVEEAVERDTRASDFVNVWTNGAEGDASPNGSPTQVGGEPAEWIRSSAAGAHITGRRTAAGILAAWRRAGRRMSGDPEIGAVRSFWRFDGSEHGGGPDGRREPVGPFPVLGVGVADEGTCAPVENMAGPGQGEKMPLIGGPGLAPDTFPVTLVRIGELAIAAYPSEITKQMGERIRAALLSRAEGRLERMAIAGLTNAYMSYTSTPEEYGACTYEGSFTLFGRQMGYAWIAAGSALVDALLRGGAPGSAPEPPQLAAGTSQTTPLRDTPQAGTAVEQPKDVNRFGRAVFRWRGGDPQVDAPRASTFVALQHHSRGAWRTLATEDSFHDTTERASGDVWTETFQFDECAPTGTYRFRVTGSAVRASGAAPAPYEVISEEFEVAPVAIDPGPVIAAGEGAQLRPHYPDPGPGALVALPRLVLGGAVTFTLADGRKVRAADPEDDGIYSAPVATSDVRAVRVLDRCGNSS